MTEQDAASLWRLASVAGVQLELPTVHPEVVLVERDAPWRDVRIPVGFAEGTAIAYALRGIPTPRPLTHALVVELLERHGVEIEALRITARQGGLFLAELETSGPRGRQVLPCRPSDGLALVLRRPMPTPILVAEGLFEADPTLPAPEPTAAESPMADSPAESTAEA